MKKIFVLVSLLVISCTLKAQQAVGKSKELGLATSFSIYNYTFRGILNPNITWRRDQFHFVVGPTLLIASNVGLNIANSPKLTGIRSSFRYVPSGLNRRFIFFFSNDLLLQRIVDRWDANAYDRNIGNYTSFRYRNVEYLVEHYVGYGFKLKIAENWHLTKGVGVGYFLSNLKGDELTADAPEIENFDYRGYKDFGFSWQIKLGASLSF